MLRRLTLTMALALVATLALAPVAMAQGKISGPMDLTWNPCYGAPPSEEMPDWIGTVELDGNTYDVLFFNVGVGRPPTEPVAETVVSASEIWALYDGLDLTFDEECAISTFDGDAVMWGHDYGLMDLAVGPEFVLRGWVIEADDDFADLVGEDVVISGTVEMDPETGAPLAAPGEFVVG